MDEKQPFNNHVTVPSTYQLFFCKALYINKNILMDCQRCEGHLYKRSQLKLKHVLLLLGSVHLQAVMTS